MNIIFTIGVSGSGKSTWATEWIKQNPNYICINRDSLRLALVKNLDGYYQRPDLNTIENIINDLTYEILDAARNNGLDLIVDNTNLTQKYINQYTQQNMITWQFKLFDPEPDLKAAKKRVFMRDHFSTFLVEKFEAQPNEKFAYMDRQYQQYTAIKSWLLGFYKEKQLL